LLRANCLFIKQSKCFFGEPTVAYLGRIISKDGMAMDPSKVAAVEAWPQPRIARTLWGFLGLTGYYRKFIVGYGAVAEPLTVLLKGRLLHQLHKHHGPFKPRRRRWCLLHCSDYQASPSASTSTAMLWAPALARCCIRERAS
jgi:hypothetical protein